MGSFWWLSETGVQCCALEFPSWGFVLFEVRTGKGGSEGGTADDQPMSTGPDQRPFITSRIRISGLRSSQHLRSSQTELSRA